MNRKRGLFTRALSKVETLLRQVGLDPRKGLSAAAQLPYFASTAFRYWRQARGSAFPLRLRDMRPMLDDRHQAAGRFNRHYLFQDLWAARKIHARQPERHVDIGSSIEGFVAHLLCFMPVEVVDIRPFPESIPGLSFIQEDATRMTRFVDCSLDSLSSLHAVEHFGLARYGDPLDATSPAAAMSSLARVLRPGGRLYFSVPVGVQRVQFNSQRIFDPANVVQAFPGLTLVSFSVVDDEGLFHEDVDPTEFRALDCGCGLYEFTKPMPGMSPGET